MAPTKTNAKDNHHTDNAADSVAQSNSTGTVPKTRSTSSNNNINGKKSATTAPHHQVAPFLRRMEFKDWNVSKVQIQKLIV